MRIGYRPIAIVVVIAAVVLGLTAQHVADSNRRKPDQSLSGMGIALLVDDNAYEANAMLNYLSDRGAAVTPVGIKAGPIPIDGTDKTPIEVSTTVTEVSGDSFDCIVIPGGNSALALATSQDALTFIRQGFGNGTVVAAICMGTQVLGQAEVVEGRTVTTLPNYFELLRSKGANIVSVRVIVDGNLITAGSTDLCRDSFLETLEEELAKR